VTPNHRPQFCTLRYKVFTAPAPAEKPQGNIVPMSLPPEKLRSRLEVLDLISKPRETDISEAEMIVAAGRGVKSAQDVALIRRLAAALHAEIACTRPLVEAGWFEARRQIGLSGRTVKPKLIIAAGISGAVQFVAGMKASDCIVAINSDQNAPIFDVAHTQL
jgi:electron transfer flavoprotein alpha subunit